VEKVDGGVGLVVELHTVVDGEHAPEGACHGSSGRFYHVIIGPQGSLSLARAI